MRSLSFVYFTLDTVYKFLGSFISNPNQDNTIKKSALLLLVSRPLGYGAHLLVFFYLETILLDEI